MVKNRFFLLEHTADMGVAVEAETLAQLFQQAALGMRQIMTATADIRPERAVVVEIEAGDREELLVNWLNELLYLFESQQLLPARFDIESIDDGHMRAVVHAERFDPLRHELDREIKAITYHQIQLEHTADGWRAQLFVDL